MSNDWFPIEIVLYLVLIVPVVCLLVMLVVLVALGRATVKAGAGQESPERTLRTLEKAAQRLAEAIREAEVLRQGLENLAANQPEKADLFSETVDRTPERPKPASVEPAVRDQVADAARRGPCVAPSEVRDNLEVVRRLLDSGVSPAEIPERTRLSESEVGLILAILDRKH